MNELFHPFLRKFVLVFFDDILIYSRDKDEHCEHVAAVLEVMRNHELYANAKKCEFGQTRVSYLGHVISEKGVAIDPSKVQSVLDWPLPRTIKELRGFLGLTGSLLRGMLTLLHH